MNTIKPNNVSFKSSRINIISVADSHGDILKLPQLMKTIQKNKKDLFEKSSEKSTYNLLAIAGDFFMNPLKRGLLTNPEFCTGDVQYNFLNKLIYIAKQAAGLKSKFDTLFTIGNHDFDGGDEWIFEKLKRAPMKTLLSNVDRSESPLPSRLMYEEPHKFIRAAIYEIPDNNDFHKTNKALILGVTIPSMNYYNPGLLKKTKFYNNSNKNDALLEEKDLRKTIRVLKNQIKEFKDKHGNGAIIVLSHTGNKISSLFAKHIPEINLIINGHDHKEFETLVGNTLILSHGQNSNLLRGTQINFEDDGRIIIQSKKIETEKNEPIARKDKKLQDFVNVNIRKDLIPLVNYKDFGATPDELVLNDSIRYSNNILANYITTGLKESAQDSIKDLDAIGIPSTIIRNGLMSNEKRSTLNNMDFLKIFDGVSQKYEKLVLGSITGKELYDLILENTINNLKSKTRNALIQWSDIQINRTQIKSYKENNANIYDNLIKIRNPQTGNFENIDFDKNYSILMSNKYLVKNTENVKIPNTIRDKFHPTSLTYDLLFKDYLKKIKHNIKITEIHRENRVL